MGHKRKHASESDSTLSSKKQKNDSSGKLSQLATGDQPRQKQPDSPNSHSQIKFRNAKRGLEGSDGRPKQPPIPSLSPSSPSASFPQLPPVPPGYLSTAPFQHGSSVTTSRITAAADSSYERLEWLGDSYIHIISSRLLYSRFPYFPENKLAGTRDRLVSNKNLAKFGRRYHFDRKVKCAEILRTDPGFGKIVADVFEAYTAAVVLGDPQHGFATAEAWLGSLWEPQIREIERVETKPTLAGNAKEELRKKIMSPGINIQYLDERPAQEDKSKGETLYFLGCYVTGWGYEKKRIGTGTGTSRVAAGNNAASDALEKEAVLLQDMAAQKKIFDEKRKQEREAAMSQIQEQPGPTTGSSSVREKETS